MSAVNHALRGELRAAHLIIRAALSVLTFDQKLLGRTQTSATA